MRVERIGLEHHCNAALGRVEIGDVLAADEDLAGGRLLETRDGAQQRGLAAAGRPDEDDELAVLDVEVDIVDHLYRAKTFVDAAQLQFSHFSSSRRTLPVPAQSGTSHVLGDVLPLGLRRL